MVAVGAAGPEAGRAAVAGVPADVDGERFAAVRRGGRWRSSWANSPWKAGYESLFATEFTVRLGSLVDLQKDLHFWVNDGLMALFFLVVGLEIKREVVSGELQKLRVATLPIMAAIGGMVAPALIYLAIAGGGEAGRGWGIPMATDIAFALGVLALAASYASPRLKPLLLTLAIVDDIGAIIVIAIFYTGGVEATALHGGVRDRRRDRGRERGAHPLHPRVRGARGRPLVRDV